MKFVKVGGVFVLVTAQVLNGDKHLEVPSYHGEPMPSNPFDVVSTASGTISSFSWDNIFLSRIPL